MWRSEVCPRAALRNAARARYPVASIRTQRFSTPDGVFAQRWPQGCKAAASVQRAGFPGARSRFVVGRTREALSCVQWCGQARRNMQLRAIPPVFPRCEFWRPGANPVHKPVGWFHSEGAGRGAVPFSDAVVAALRSLESRSLIRVSTSNSICYGAICQRRVRSRTHGGELDEGWGVMEVK